MLMIKVIQEPDGRFSAFADRDGKAIGMSRGKTETDAVQRIVKRVTKPTK